MNNAQVAYDIATGNIKSIYDLGLSIAYHTYETWLETGKLALKESENAV